MTSRQGPNDISVASMDCGSGRECGNGCAGGVGGSGSGGDDVFPSMSEPYAASTSSGRAFREGGIDYASKVSKH
jgi:hypothetical protein